MKILNIAIAVIIGVHFAGCTSLHPESTEMIISHGELTPSDARYGD